MKATILITALLIMQSATAREVDNYLAWGVDLDDSAPQIDRYMREKLAAAITSTVLVE